MALFRDGPISGLEDLTAYDAQLLIVANVEGIDVTQKLALAQEDIELQIHAMLSDSRSAQHSVWLKPSATSRNVAVTAPLKRWHTLRALELIYEDAYSSQLNDRYAAKLKQFGKRARSACDMLRETGIGIVWSPIPRAEAPQVASTQGNLADGTYYVAMTWTNSKNEEGAPSTVATITTSSSTFAVLPGAPPEGVTGWSVYAGIDPDSMSRQNDSPLVIGAAWLEPDGMVTGGGLPGNGQSPNSMAAAPRMILRG